MSTDREPVSGSERAFGWILMVAYLFAAERFVDWLNPDELPWFLQILCIPLALIGLGGTLAIAFKFDLMGDRRA